MNIVNDEKIILLEEFREYFYKKNIGLALWNIVLHYCETRNPTENQLIEAFDFLVSNCVTINSGKDFEEFVVTELLDDFIDYCNDSGLSIKDSYETSTRYTFIDNIRDDFKEWIIEKLGY